MAKKWCSQHDWLLMLLRHQCTDGWICDENFFFTEINVSHCKCYTLVFSNAKNKDEYSISNNRTITNKYCILIFSNYYHFIISWVNDFFFSSDFVLFRNDISVPISICFRMHLNMSLFRNMRVLVARPSLTKAVCEFSKLNLDFNYRSLFCCCFSTHTQKKQQQQRFWPTFWRVIKEYLIDLYYYEYVYLCTVHTFLSLSLSLTRSFAMNFVRHMSHRIQYTLTYIHLSSSVFISINYLNAPNAMCAMCPKKK